MADKPETQKILDEISRGTNPKPGTAAARSRTNARKRFLIIMVLLLPLLGFLGYLGYEQMNLRSAVATLVQQGTSLEAGIGRLRQEVDELREQVVQIAADSAADDSEIRELGARVESGLNSLERQLQTMETLQEQVQGLASDSPGAAAPGALRWKILEAEYLVQLAVRKLQLESDQQTAILLLRQADAALVDSGSNSVLSARQAIAGDLALLQDRPDLDREGVYLRIANLHRQTDALILPLGRDESSPGRQGGIADPLPAADETRSFLHSSLDLLGEVFVWRRWQDSPQAILEPGQRMLVRQRMHLMLEQAQLALMSGDQALYQRSLAEGASWLRQYAVIESSAGQAMLAEISALQEIDIAPELPLIARSANTVQQLAASVR